jgi:uncharacterized protein with HEPN domain
MREKISNEARLRHISDAINDIESFTEGLSISEFKKNSLVKSATVRQLEIIGEASNHLTTELREKYSEIDWKEVIGFRNIVVHEYFIVDYSIVWHIVQNYIPELKLFINEVLDKEFNNN